ISRGESANALAVERVDNEHSNWQIEKCEHGERERGEPANAREAYPPIRPRARRPRDSRQDAGATSGAHEKLHFFSRRSERKSRPTTISSMQKEIAAPSGQL